MACQLKESCDLCTWGLSTPFPCVAGLGPDKEQIDVMVIGDMPVYDRQSCSIKPMKQQSLAVLGKAFNYVGLDLTQVYFTNVMHCVSPDEKAPTQKELKTCAAYVREEIEKVKPKFVLLLGATALKGVLGKAKITDVHGTVFEENGIQYMPTFHPSAIVREPTQFDAWVEDIKKFSCLVTGKSSVEWPKLNWFVVDTWEKLDTAIKDIQSTDAVSFDLETSDLNPYKDERWVNAYTVTTDNAQWIVPCEFHASKWKGDRENQLIILQTIKDVIKEKKVVGHNGKFDNKWLQSVYGLRFPMTFDTMLAAHLLDENLPSISLKYLARRFFNAPEYDIAEKEKMGDCDPERFYTYLAMDGYYTLKLYRKFKPELEAAPNLKAVFVRIVMPASHAFEKIEANGVYIDIDRFFSLEKKLLKDQERLDAELQALAPINWRSTKQVADVLYNQWHLQIIERTDTGAPSTAEPVIKRLKGQHPGVATLLEYRTTTKTISSFIEGWKKFIGADNRMHPTFNIWGTKTGRLSCADPNLQQVPKDKDIRSLVTAPPGWTFIEADLSQIELRIAAMLAREPTMIAIYKEGKIDLHTYTASIISGKSVDEVTKADRSAAKPVNFGLLYGMQAPTLKEYAYVNYEMELTLEDAVEFREKFFQAYSGLLAWHEEQKQEVRTFGCVKTPVGRIRHLPAIYGDRKAQAEAERQAINSPVQSFGSDMCVSAIIQLANTLDPAEARIVGNVHDAILLEVRNDKVDEVAAKVKAAMEAPDIILKKFGVKFPLPIEAEVKISPDGWGTERKEPKKPETPGMPDLCEVCKERPATDQFTFEDGQKLWLCVVCLESAENSM